MILNNRNFKQLICKLAVCGSLTFMCGSVSVAGIYKWTDAEGNVHYGQQRPAGTSSEKMQVPQHAPIDKSSYKRPGQKSADEKTDKASADKKAEEPAEEKETKAEKKQRMANCEKVRKNLATMKSNSRIRSKDEDGNIRYLSDEEKQARMNKSQQALDKHCK